MKPIKPGPRETEKQACALVVRIVADLASGHLTIGEIAVRRRVRPDFVTAVAVVSGRGTDLTRLSHMEVMVRREVGKCVAAGWKGTHWGPAIGRSQRYNLGRAWRLWQSSAETT